MQSSWFFFPIPHISRMALVLFLSRPSCYSKCPKQSSTLCGALTDKPSIYTRRNPLFLQLNCPTLVCKLSNRLATLYTFPSDKTLVLYSYLSCQFLHHRKTENCTSQQFEGHLCRSFSQGFYCKIIWKAWGVVAFEDGSPWDARAYKWLPLSTNWK